MQQRYCLAAAAFSLAAFFCGGAARAQLTVDRLWVDFGPGDPSRGDIVIRNESRDRYYISVTPSEILAPGTDAEKRISISDPEQLGILVTPNRLIVDPGGVRSIRVVSLNSDLKTDRVYRIRIEPQVGEISGAASAAGNRGLTIKVLAAYDILVTARAKDPKVDLVVDRQPTEVTIRNAGSTNTLLVDGQACGPSTAESSTSSAKGEEQPKTDKAETCSSVGSHRLYAGSEWKIPISNPATQLRFKERRSTIGTPKDVVF